MNKETLVTNQETLQKGLKGMAELVDQNKEQIKANKENIKANKDKIEKNIASIDANKAKIELNHKSIQDVKSQLNARLNNLNKDLRRGLATQSALTGLFQPYSVGKMNVTAAVGGYQSEKAIAVGSGYRFNDNFAAKVGLSKSLGGSAVSYNMGVNYEF
ncbi:YadA-like family protein [Pasteurella canis]|nr:YadA-like family protein [Pasteurella canis]